MRLGLARSDETVVLHVAVPVRGAAPPLPSPHHAERHVPNRGGRLAVSEAFYLVHGLGFELLPSEPVHEDDHVVGKVFPDALQRVLVGRRVLVR